MKITLGGACVLLIASCAAPLPRLNEYSTENSGVPILDKNTWKIAEDGDLDDTVQMLLQDPDPEVRAHAGKVESMLQTLASERRSEMKSIILEETDELKQASRLATAGDETDQLPDELDPMALRRRLIEDAIKAEDSGDFGMASKLATTAMSLEWIVDDRVMVERVLENPVAIASRNNDRMKNIRLVDPMIAVHMIDPESAVEQKNFFEEKGPVVLKQKTSVRDRIMNTARAIEYFETLHVTETDRKSIHQAGIRELILLSRALVEQGHEIPKAFLDFLEDDLRDYEDGETLKLLIALNFAQQDLAGDALPDGFSLRVFGDGAAGALDKQTSVIWPMEFEQYQKSSSRGYRGIGVQVEEKTNGNVVLTPHSGGPAKCAGVRLGDVLLEADGRPISEIGARGLADVVDEEGRTSIDLLVRHQDDTIETITVRLGPVINLNVTGWRQVGLKENGLPTWWWLADDEKRIGYLRLQRFASGGARDVRKALKRAQSQAQSCGGRLEGLILDLRSNPGGQVLVAEEVINLFMGEGRVFRSIGRDGHVETLHASENHSELEGLPLVILVDENSASASELVAGLLKRNDKAIILGERTYGKGSVQGLLPASSLDCLIRVTIAWYQLPDEDRSLSEWRFVDRETSPRDWGVEPHVRISTSIDQTKNILNARSTWYSGVGEDVVPSDDLVESMDDPATELALGLLRSKINDIDSSTR